MVFRHSFIKVSNLIMEITLMMCDSTMVMKSSMGPSNHVNGSIFQSPSICLIFEVQNRRTIKQASLYRDSSS